MKTKLDASAHAMEDMESKTKSSFEDMKTKLDASAHAMEDMESKTKSSFIEHNNAYIATTFCRNAAYTCTLLQSHIALQMQSDRAIDSKSRRVIESLQVDLMKALGRFLEFLEANKQGLTPETLKALQYSWSLAKDSLCAYIEADAPNKVALVEEFFPDTADILRELYDKIDEHFKKR